MQKSLGLFQRKRDIQIFSDICGSETRSSKNKATNLQNYPLGSLNPYPGPILMLIIIIIMIKLYLCLEPDKAVKIILKELKLKAIKIIKWLLIKAAKIKLSQTLLKSSVGRKFQHLGALIVKDLSPLVSELKMRYCNQQGSVCRTKWSGGHTPSQQVWNVFWGKDDWGLKMWVIKVWNPF